MATRAFLLLMVLASAACLGTGRKMRSGEEMVQTGKAEDLSNTLGRSLLQFDTGNPYWYNGNQGGRYPYGYPYGGLVSKVNPYGTVTSNVYPYGGLSTNGYPYGRLPTNGYPYGGVVNNGYPYGGVVNNPNGNNGNTIVNPNPCDQDEVLVQTPTGLQCA